MPRTRRGLRSVSAAPATVTAPVRCAVYCRVSTDAQADKEFNSVEAQQEACETYIGLHREEGWTAIPDAYLDAGFTGANTKRPGLQRLMADIEAGDVQVVVVYKYDRLSRSMLDFLQLLDLFKRHDVSFVSVSQRFDTSTPVGEVTLNILLSFAQFERQMIAERTRDKVHAARRHGRWTGGTPPLGYDTIDRKLVVNKPEAEQVRAIFDLYIERRSLLQVAQELNRRGWRKKSWTTKAGKRREGSRWCVASVRKVIANALYTGQQRLGDETFKGDHDAIVTRKTFNEAQRILAGNRCTRGAANRNTGGFLLRGLLRCTACDAAMTPVPTRKRQKLYRYYRCENAIKRGAAACPGKQISADAIETVVVDQIRRLGADEALLDETFRVAVGQVKATRRDLRAERKRLDRDRETAQDDVSRLVAALSRTDGPAADAVAQELAAARERAQAVTVRLGEIKLELKTLDPKAVDRDDLARALRDFDPIWEALLVPERERIVALLVDAIELHPATGDTEIRWRLDGFGDHVEDMS